MVMDFLSLKQGLNILKAETGQAGQRAEIGLLGPTRGQGPLSIDGRNLTISAVNYQRNGVMHVNNYGLTPLLMSFTSFV